MLNFGTDLGVAGGQNGVSRLSSAQRDLWDVHGPDGLDGDAKLLMAPLMFLMTAITFLMAGSMFLMAFHAMLMVLAGGRLAVD